MARVAVYGGSFDPPHVSHVLTVAWALSACPVDEVWLVPVWQHAFGKRSAPFADRVEMCRRAMAPFGKHVSVTEVERELGGTSRTIDTLSHLERSFPDNEFSLLMGTDLFADCHKWKAFDEIERRYTFHVAGRAGAPGPESVPAGPPLPPVSSTDVRRRLAEGLPLGGRVPLAVLEYVRKVGLYGGAGDRTS